MSNMAPADGADQAAPGSGQHPVLSFLPEGQPRLFQERPVAIALRNLTKRGGSHTGALQPARQRDGVCPLDGAPLLRRTIGGRTTFSCPVHQV